MKAGDNAPGYGLGWTVDGEGEELHVGHSGGGVAAMMWYPSSRTAIVVLTNGRTNPDSLLAGLTKVALGEVQRVASDVQGVASDVQGSTSEL